MTISLDTIKKSMINDGSDIYFDYEGKQCGIAISNLTKFQS